MCLPCERRRSERREIITELYETELKYGRDLRIIVEEFYRPMLVAGLLTSDQLAGIFLNAEELIQVMLDHRVLFFKEVQMRKLTHRLPLQVNACFSNMLRDSIEEASMKGDSHLVAVNVGKIFLESLFMLRAYESYCTRQVLVS